MRLLVVGGTVFVGRAVVAAALARGHDVTVFHRGEHGETVLPAAVRHLHGDRRTPYALAGTRWDAVVDTCGFTPDDLAPVLDALRGGAGHYAFVSSVSAHPGWPAAAVGDRAPVYGDDAPPGYGPDKARCERAVLAAYGDRALVARPGLIVGPHENLGRLPFWLRRAARGGELVAPGPPGEPRQWVDARDLAEWLVAMAERGRGGVHDVVSAPGAFTMGDVVAACVAATGSGAVPRWVAPERIAAAGIEPWTELPIWMWSAEEPVAHTWAVDPSGAVAAGFAARPVAETVGDTWRWLRGGDAVGDYRAEHAVRDLDPDREAALASLGRNRG